MSDEEGNESFSINDRDLFYALNPHKRKRMSKEQQIYGVWADREEEEDATDERPSFSSAAKTMMNFVSGGTQKTGEDQQEEEKEVPVKKPKVSSNYPSAAKNQVFAGMRDAAGPKIDWAKGSKGNVIMNMMKKMGYEHGKGLGATKQGIVEPVEAKVRPGRAAIGAYGSEGKGLKFGESAADAHKRNLDIDDEDVEVQDDLPKPSSGKWKKSGAKQKVSYRTIDEVLEEEGGARFDMGSAGGSKIIDMTGPVQKVYNDYNAFSTRTKTAVIARQGFDVPDLTHNLDMLLGMSEDEIRKNDNEARNRKAENEANEVHLKELDEVRKQQHDRVRSLEQIIGILELFSENTGEQSLDDYKELTLRLKKLGYTRFGNLSIDRCILSRILPVFVRQFSRWNPLDPNQVDSGFVLLQEWMQILETGSKIGKNNELCSFDELLWNSWMPIVRRSALSWSPREATPVMTNLVETWAKVLPAWMLDNLLDQIIFPRLHADVDQWKPTSDCIPIDQWLVPWVYIMGDRLQPLLLSVRQKIGKALSAWEATDPSAIHLLSPWKDVFSRGTMSAFVGHHIAPKLAHALARMNMDPSENTDYHEFFAVISWYSCGLLSSEATTNMLLNNFFPKFYHTLCIWLDAPQVVRTEVSLWYSEWRERIPKALRDEPLIKGQFLGGLQAMNQSLNGFKVTGWTPQAHLEAATPGPAVPSAQPQRPAGSGAYERSTFKKLLQRRAEEEQIPFTPLNRLHLQYQLYKCGTKTLYFADNLIYAMDPTKRYKPIGLEDLIERCKEA